MVVNTMELLSIFPPATDNFVTLLGYHTRGDGGGGDFYWDSTAIADSFYDGGTIVKSFAQGGYLNEDGTIHKGTQIPGSWRRLYSGAVNVRWFGAMGNRANNDTTAIQKAINLFNNVFLPAGTYYVEFLYINKPNFKITGESATQSVITTFGVGVTRSYLILIGDYDSTEKALKAYHTISNICISDLKIDGNNLADYCIECHVELSLIEKLWLTN